MQLDKDAGKIEILCDYATKKVIQLGKLFQDW